MTAINKMDSRMYLACLTVIALLHRANAGCVQDLSSNQGYVECIQGYAMYISNAVSSMDPNDPNAMMSLMCSTEGKAAVKCVLDYVKSCPDLMTTGDNAAMLQGLKTFEQFGGFDAACNMLSGPCQAVQQCLSGLSLDGDAPMPSTFPTPFSTIQLSVKSVCGPLKGMFDCFKDVGDKCQDLEKNIETALEMGRREAPAGTTIPTYEQTKTFIMKDCPSFPKDFATSTCVKNTLVSDAFVKCYENLTATYPTENNKISCDAYRAGHKCMSMTVGKTCGKQYTDAFVKATPMFLVGMPTNCKLESSDTSGTSGLMYNSVASFVLAVFLAVKLV